jgi:Ca2+:H+ antiporter
MLRDEWPLLVLAGTAGSFLVFGRAWLADLSNPGWLAFVFAWLFASILLGATAVVRHAEGLAARVGEPLGTLILTLSVTGIEVMMIASVMSTGAGHAELARDAMFAAVMIVMNGMVGLSLVLGGLRHHEQTYNLQGANTFLAVIAPLVVFGLVVPNFTASSPGPTFSTLQSTFLIVASVALYGVFLLIQNLRHRDYFAQPTPADSAGSHRAEAAPDLGVRPPPYRLLFLLAYLGLIVAISDQIAVPIDYGITMFKAPAALGGLIVSVLVLSSESLGAVRAALANQLQRSVNLLLGSVLATISLTVPAVLVISLISGRTIVLGLEGVDMALLVLTLGVASLTFSSARTNVLLGAVHLVLFLAYLILMFDR